jgi:hypothetical protein
VSVKQVKAAIREAVATMADADVLRQEWLLEDHRLKTLGLRFYEMRSRKTGKRSSGGCRLSESERTQGNLVQTLRPPT